MQTSKIDNFLGQKIWKNTYSSKCFSWQCFRVSWQSLNLCSNLFFFFFYDLRGWFFFCFLVWCEIWSSDWYQQGLSWSVLPALQPPVLSLYSGGKHQDIQPLLYSLHPKGFNLARSQCVSTELSILGHWPLGNRYGFAQRLSFWFQITQTGRSWGFCWIIFQKHPKTANLLKSLSNKAS